MHQSKRRVAVNTASNIASRRNASPPADAPGRSATLQPALPLSGARMRTGIMTPGSVVASAAEPAAAGCATAAAPA